MFLTGPVNLSFGTCFIMACVQVRWDLLNVYAV